MGPREAPNGKRKEHAASEIRAPLRRTHSHGAGCAGRGLDSPNPSRCCYFLSTLCQRGSALVMAERTRPRASITVFCTHRDPQRARASSAAVGCAISRARSTSCHERKSVAVEHYRGLASHSGSGELRPVRIISALATSSVFTDRWTRWRLLSALAMWARLATSAGMLDCQRPRTLWISLTHIETAYRAIAPAIGCRCFSMRHPTSIDSRDSPGQCSRTHDGERVSQHWAI